MTDNSEHNIPTAEVAHNAQKGLDLHHKFKRGGTEIGVARAHQLAKREHIDIKTVKRMVSYFARHTVDKDAPKFGDEENPSKGYIAWLLWGGDAGQKWAEKIKDKADKATKK